MTTLTTSHQHQSIPSDLPIGTLPPRKRAKTDEEKEQRRVERILRNRRAAHASREKKRRHVEYLEAYVSGLESSLSVHELNQLKLQTIQSSLITLLKEHGIDYSSIDFSIQPTPKVRKPDGLDLSQPNPAKKQRTSLSKSGSKKNSPKMSEIPSPSFDEDVSSDEEDDDVEAEVEEEERLEAPEKAPVKFLDLPEEHYTKKRKAEEAYISPPGSTSPSKLKLEEDELVLKQEYSNLFDDTEDLFSTEKSSSLELFKQGDSPAEQFVKQEDDLLKIPETVFNTEEYLMNPVEDLCAFNSVHHPAVMIV